MSQEEKAESSAVPPEAAEEVQKEQEDQKSESEKVEEKQGEESPSPTEKSDGGEGSAQTDRRGAGRGRGDRGPRDTRGPRQPNIGDLFVNAPIIVSLEQAKEELQRIGKRGKGHDVRRAVDIGTELLRSNAQHKRDAASFAKKEQAFKELRKNYAEQTEEYEELVKCLNSAVDRLKTENEAYRAQLMEAGITPVESAEESRPRASSKESNGGVDKNKAAEGARNQEQPKGGARGGKTGGRGGRGGKKNSPVRKTDTASSAASGDAASSSGESG